MYFILQMIEDRKCLPYTWQKQSASSIYLHNSTRNPLLSGKGGQNFRGSTKNVTTSWTLIHKALSVITSEICAQHMPELAHATKLMLRNTMGYLSENKMHSE